MKYIIKIRAGKNTFKVPVRAPSAVEALQALNPFVIEEVIPDTKPEDLFNPVGLDFTRDNKIGIEAEPYIPDSLRNSLLLDLANFITGALRDYVLSRELQHKKEGIKDKLNQIYRYFKKDL